MQLSMQNLDFLFSESAGFGYLHDRTCDYRLTTSKVEFQLNEKTLY